MSNRIPMEPAKKPSNKKALRWLFKRVGTARVWILISVGLGLSSGILLIAQARFLSIIVHGAFMEKHSIDLLWPLFSALVAVIILRAALGWAREVSGFYAGARIRQDQPSVFPAAIHHDQGGSRIAEQVFCRTAKL